MCRSSSPSNLYVARICSSTQHSPTRTRSGRDVPPGHEVEGDCKGHDAPPRRTLVQPQGRPLMFAPRPAHLAPSTCLQRLSRESRRDETRMKQRETAGEACGVAPGCDGPRRRQSVCPLSSCRTPPTTQPARSATAADGAGKRPSVRKVLTSATPTVDYLVLSLALDLMAPSPLVETVGPLDNEQDGQDLASLPKLPMDNSCASALFVRTVAGAAWRTSSSMDIPTRISNAKLSFRPSCSLNFMVIPVAGRCSLFLLRMSLKWLKKGITATEVNSMPPTQDYGPFHGDEVSGVRLHTNCTWSSPTDSSLIERENFLKRDLPTSIGTASSLCLLMKAIEFQLSCALTSENYALACCYCLHFFPCAYWTETHCFRKEHPGLDRPSNKTNRRLFRKLFLEVDDCVCCTFPTKMTFFKGNLSRITSEPSFAKMMASDVNIMSLEKKCSTQ